MRKAAGTWAAKILFILLILSFGAWGIGDYLRPNVNQPVATVGDLEISQQELSREFQRELERLRLRSGGALTRELALQLGFGNQVLSSLVERRLLTLEARDLGVRISDDLVRQRILSEPAFQEGGNFDRQRFAEALRMNGLTEEGFVAILRGDITRELVSGAITAGVSVPQSLAEALYRYRQEERLAELLFLPNDAAGAVPEPTDADIAAHYEQTKDRYSVPEMRAVTAVLLRPDDVAETIAVSDAQIREAYQARQNEFRIPETRNVRQLLFTYEAQARAAVERLAGGASFDEVAAEAAAGGAQRSDLGQVRKGDLFPASVENAVFGLAAPGVTPPVQSPVGWHVLQVTDITPGSVPPREAVEAQLRREIGRERAVDEIIRLSNQVEDALAGGNTLEQLAEQMKLPLVRIAAMDRSGKDEAGNPVPDLPQAPTFVANAFDTAQGEVSRLIETPDGGYFVLRVDKVIPRAPRPLDAVRDQVVSALNAERARELARSAGQALLERARSGESLADIARSQGTETRTSPGFTRQSNLPAERLPAGLVESLFRAKIGDVVMEPMADGVVLARLTEIRAADPAGSGERVASLRADMLRRMTNDVQAQYATALQSRHGVRVDEDAVRRAL